MRAKKQEYRGGSKHRVRRKKAKAINEMQGLIRHEFEGGKEKKYREKTQQKECGDRNQWREEEKARIQKQEPIRHEVQDDDEKKDTGSRKEQERIEEGRAEQRRKNKGRANRKRRAQGEEQKSTERLGP